ncbi:ABC transporter permease [Nocardia goodfellowii]|uniref:ABC transport system permease protein n=1 Tax=Nocardia goodfellowii TaxID=882446 RepID=A0ABS4QPM0_9NOCA|nr:ABC transporter permease [Nocardia goodfellowii]MBP2192581.1 putative ABC transport system permease protein [Nocardia goodfellowii]
MNTVVTPGIGLALLCLAFVAGAALIYRVARLGPLTVPPFAAGRAVLQLAGVAVVLAAALAQLWSSVLVLLVMFGAAVGTAARRARAGWSAAWLAMCLGAGLLVTLPPMLVSGVVPLTGIAVVPIGGILLGGTMTATSLAARRALDALTERCGEVEAALSLGFTDRAARLEVIRPTATDALLPGVDQTRTVGLVTLPGAFVGVLLASGSAAQAAAVQVLVLLGLLLAQSCAVAVTVELVARGRVRRPRQRIGPR